MTGFKRKSFLCCIVSGVKLQTKHNGHLTFQHVIDCWDMHLDAGMPGAILSCDVVATCGFISHNCVINKQEIKFG